MSDRSEKQVEEIASHLRQVAIQSEILRPTELVLSSPDMVEAAAGIDTFIQADSPAVFLRLTIGRKAIDALSFSRTVYDQIQTRKELVEPGESYQLRYKFSVRTDPFSHITEPVYGFLRYFDLATMGRTIEDGGSLTLDSPEQD
jgi:hypothetical protein